MTVPQIREDIAQLLHSACGCDRATRIAGERTRKLQRNELARLYHWKRCYRLPPLNIEKRQL